MPSTYSPNLRIELIGTGEQAGTWGVTTNTNLGTLIEDAIAGYVSVSVTSADQALTALNGAADQSRNMTINLTTTTTANFNVYIPPAEKFYVIRNTTAYTATIYCSTVLGNTTAAGTGVTVLANTTTVIFSDATNVREAINSFPGNLVINGSVGIGGAASSARSLYVQSTALTGTTQIGVDSRPVFTSGATSAGYGIISSPATAAASFTQANLYGIGVLDATKGAGSTITNQFGIRIFDQTQGGTANYGLFMDVSSGSDKWNIYASGTANNYFAGAVLVGTTASQTLAGTTGNIQVETPNSASNITVVRNTANTSGPIFAFGKSRGGALGSRTAAASGDLLGTVAFNGADGTNMVTGAAIYAEVDGTVSTGVMPTSIQFYTENAAGTFAARMRLDSSGNLGLGVTPSAWGSGYKAIQISTNGVLYNTSGNNYFGSNVYNDGTNLKRITTAAVGLFGVESGNVYKWYQAASDTAGTNITLTTAMTLTSGADLGIGVAAPAARLHVVDSGGQNGTIKLGGSSADLGLVIAYNQASATTTTITSNPTYSSTSSAMILRVDGDNSATANQLYLRGNGYVGIGTIPSITFHAANADAGGQSGANPSNEVSRISQAPTAGSGGFVIQRLILDKTSLANNGAAQSFEALAAGGDRYAMANIGGYIETAGTGNAVAGYFSILTKPASGDLTERLRVTSTGDLRFNSGYGSVAAAYGCRAWVTFNAVGTLTVRASANVTSVTDNNVGDFTVNFTNSMPDANYATVGMAGSLGTATASLTAMGIKDPQSTSVATGSVRVTVHRSNGTDTDWDYNSVAVFR